MTSQIIKIEPSKTRTFSSDQSQYQEWVARFCYASAKLPPKTVEHILDLMETCGDSDDIGLAHKEGMLNKLLSSQIITK